MRKEALKIFFKEVKSCDQASDREFFLDNVSL